MRMIQNQKTNILSFLPNGSDYRKENEIVKDLMIKKALKSRNDPSIEDLIIELVVLKLTSQENAWTKKEYSKFSRAIYGINDNQLDIIKGSLVDCLCASDIEIQKNLKGLANLVEFYPEVERIYDKKTKTYQIVEKEIQSIDCFQVIRQLFTKMQSYSYLTAQKLLATGEDYDEISQCIQDAIDTKESNAYLEGFDNNFSCLDNFPIFSNIYHQYRNIHLALIKKNLFEIHMDQCAKEQAIQNAAIISYSKDNCEYLQKRKARNMTSYKSKRKRQGIISSEEYQRRNQL